MSCPSCGAPLPENSRFCDRCGAPAIAPSNPVGAPVTFPAPAGETSGKALASLITGIFGILLFPAAIVAIILGHMSQAEIRKSNGHLQGSGMALTGLILGYAGIAFIPIILIIAAIAIPNLLRARIAANEVSAVHSVRRIHTAEVTYYLANPGAGYTCTLSNLAGSERVSSVAKARLIDDRLASGTKNGYQFIVRNCIQPEKGEGKYQLVAYPVSPNQTGVKAFCTDETGVIRFDPTGSPDDCLANGEPLAGSR
jgi:type II secretory pathway pseudopilin PulG